MNRKSCEEIKREIKEYVESITNYECSVSEGETIFFVDLFYDEFHLSFVFAPSSVIFTSKKEVISKDYFLDSFRIENTEYISCDDLICWVVNDISFITDIINEAVKVMRNVEQKVFENITVVSYKDIQPAGSLNEEYGL